MIRQYGFACLAASLGLSLACNRGPDIEEQTRELAEARTNTGSVAKDLEAELQKAKAEVAELEKKLALAREGITDEVLEERKELQGALESQRREVQKDVNEARRESQLLDKGTDRAMQQLQETQPPAKVDTQVKTETDVVRGAQQQVEAPTREEIVPVRGGPEQRPAAGEPEVESTTSTTRTAPVQPGVEHPEDAEHPEHQEPAREPPVSP